MQEEEKKKPVPFTSTIDVDARIPIDLVPPFQRSPEYRRLVGQARAAIADFVRRTELEEGKVAAARAVEEKAKTPPPPPPAPGFRTCSACKGTKVVGAGETCVCAKYGAFPGFERYADPPAPPTSAPTADLPAADLEEPMDLEDRLDQLLEEKPETTNGVHLRHERDGRGDS